MDHYALSLIAISKTLLTYFFIEIIDTLPSKSTCLSPMLNLLLLILSVVSTMKTDASFKQKQMLNPKVKLAYQEKGKEVIATLKKLDIEVNNLEICIMAFKQEQVLELWGRNKGNAEFKLIKEFSICASSGVLGPKRKEGDMQVPEGFYQITHFNPESNYYLSLGQNYPNASDRILSDKKHPGGSIYIHGNCVTIGCIPITDDLIKELYIYALEAKNNRQEHIPVSIFPCRMNNENLKLLKKQYSSNKQLISFWENLKPGYDYFDTHKICPQIKVLADGRYSFH